MCLQVFLDHVRMNASFSSSVRVAVVGYGNAGRIFHAPLVAGVPRLQLHTVVSSKPEAVTQDWPQVRVLPTAAEAFACPQVDVVVIATDNASHFPLAQAALQAGKHVVVDKPCTVTLEQTQRLLALAQAQNRVLTVFQNRRWDADFVALQQVLASGVLGRVVMLESHFDRYRPTVPERWREQALPGSGLWMDLGAHLVDQALQLFGEPYDLLLDWACQRDAAVVNDYFHAQLRYPQTHPGLRVLLHASAMVPSVGPRFVVHGTHGSWVKYGLDVQEDALKAGQRPQLASLGDWGRDPQGGSLHLATPQGLQTTAGPNPRGNYLQFYAHLRDHLLGREPYPPVKPAEVEAAMRWLSVGAQSVEQGCWVCGHS